MAKPLPMAAVVLPTASSLSVMTRTSAGQVGGFGNAAGIIGDGAEGVDGDRRANKGQHAQSRTAQCRMYRRALPEQIQRNADDQHRQQAGAGADRRRPW